MISLPEYINKFYDVKNGEYTNKRTSKKVGIEEVKIRYKFFITNINK